jgi:hypothetical protein
MVSALLSACAGNVAPLASGNDFVRFHADVEPFDSGGECVEQPRQGSDSRVIYSVYYPSRADARSVLTLVYDGRGRLRQTTEARGVVTVSGLGPNPTPRAVDSAFKAVQDTLRTTFISLDYGSSRASAVNRGGGRPERRVNGELDEALGSPALGAPGERVQQAAKICGIAGPAER